MITVYFFHACKSPRLSTFSDIVVCSQCGHRNKAQFFLPFSFFLHDFFLFSFFILYSIFVAVYIDQSESYSQVLTTTKYLKKDQRSVSKIYFYNIPTYNILTMSIHEGLGTWKLRLHLFSGDILLVANELNLEFQQKC